MEEIIEKRVYKDKQSMGFQHGVPTKWKSKEGESLFQHITADDLMEYGFIPEFVGRLPVVASLVELDKDALVKVLTEPKNAFIKQYQCLFEMDNVELVFSDEALAEAAEQALLQKTGARGLRTILERTLLDVMYELPSMEGVRRCIVGTDAILGNARVTLEMESGDIVSLPPLERKSA